MEGAKEMQKEKKKGKVGALKFFSWNLRGMSTAVQVVMIGYITFYCTEVLQLNAALVATLLFASKIVDAVTDLMAGYLIDRTHTKLGKGRPYELALIGLWVTTWLSFSVPTQFSTAVKCVWVVVCYILAQSIFNTLLAANQTAYMVRAFNDQDAYVTLSSLGGLITVLGVIIFNVVYPGMMANAGKDASAWSRMVLMIAAPLCIIGLMRFFFVPEKYDVDAGTDPVRFQDVLTLLKTNRFIYIIAAVSLVNNFSAGLGVSVYYYTYIVKNLGIMGIMSLFTVVSMLTLTVYPVLLKKITVRQLIQLGLLFSVAGGILNFVAKDNIILLGIASLVGGIGSLPISMMLNLLIIECADFNEWKGRQRMEGTLGAVNGFSAKLGSALGTFLCGILLSAAGYVGGAAVQTESALHMIRALFGLVPAAFFLALFLLMNLYKLDRMMPQIRKENEERHAAQAEGVQTAQ